MSCAVENGRWVLTDLPAAPRAAVPGRRVTALHRDEARRIAANIPKLPLTEAVLTRLRRGTGY